MKKGKYIDYNILLACLSKGPQATSTNQLLLKGKRGILEELYDALTITGVLTDAEARMRVGDGELVNCI